MAHVPHMMKDLPRAGRKGSSETFLEHSGDGAWQAKQGTEGRTGPGSLCLLQNVRDVLVVEPWNNGREGDPCRNPRLRKDAQCLHASRRRGNMRFHVSRHVRVHEGYADVDAKPGPTMQVLEPGEVPEDKRALGDKDHGIAEFAANLQAGTREAIRSLQGLVAVGISREGHQLACPRCAGKSLVKQGGGIAFDDEFGFEVRAGAEPPIFVSRSGIAVGASVKAAPVWVDAPMKSEVGAFVSTQDFAGVVFKDLYGDGGGRLEQLAVSRFKRIGRISDLTHPPMVASSAETVKMGIATPHPGRLV